MLINFVKRFFHYWILLFFVRIIQDVLIKLALFEWFVQEVDENEESWYGSSRIDVAECFGLFELHEYRHEFFPASGAKGPFQNLLKYHHRKGLDFILKLLNKASDKYAHSNLDGPQDSSSLENWIS